MYKAAVRWMIRRGVRDLNAGNPDPQIAAYADDAVLVFPGNNTWSGEYRGREAIAGFMRRFAETGFQGTVADILVNGPPWATRVAVVFPVTAAGEDGTVRYANRAVLYARIRWGKITYQEDFEDTHKSETFDRYLQDREQARGQSASR
jgi:uncharacterized protein (TIGR02246 family)